MASNSQELSLQDFQNFSDLDQEHEESGDTLNFLQNKLKRKSQESGALYRIEEVSHRAVVQNQIKKLPLQQFPIVNNPFDLMNKQISQEKPTWTNANVQLEKEPQKPLQFPVADLFNKQANSDKPISPKYNTEKPTQQQLPSMYPIVNNLPELNYQKFNEEGLKQPRNGKVSYENTFNQTSINNQFLLQNSQETSKKQSFLRQQQNPSPKGVHQWMKETLDKQEYICYLSLRQELYKKRLEDIHERYKGFVYSLNDWRQKLYEQADQMIEDYKLNASQILQQQEQAAKNLIAEIDKAKYEVNASHLQQYTHIEPYYKPAPDCFDHLKDQFEQLLEKMKNDKLNIKGFKQSYPAQQYSPILVDKEQARYDQPQFPSFNLSPPKNYEQKEPTKESLNYSPYKQLLQQQIQQAPSNQLTVKDKTPPREENLDRLLQRLEAKQKPQNCKSPNKSNEPHLRTYSTTLLHQQQSCFREYSGQKKDQWQTLSDQKLGLQRFQTNELKYQFFKKQNQTIQRSPYDLSRYNNTKNQKTPNSKLLNPFQTNSRLVSPQKGVTNIIDAIYKQQNFFYDRRNNFR